MTATDRTTAPEEGIDQPRGLVGPCLLLLLSEQPSHGYELMVRLREFGFDWDGPGPIYRELRQMARQGLVVATVAPPVGDRGGPATSRYELTEKGWASLDGCARAAARLAATLGNYVERSRASSQSRPATQPAQRRFRRRAS